MDTFDTDPAADASVSFRAPLLVMALLTLTAGFADGHALTKAGIFVANQSGNVVHIGMGLVGQDPQWPLALLSMVGFALGAMAAWGLGRLAARHPWSLIRMRLSAVTALILVWWLVLTVFGVEEGWVTAFVGAMTMGVLASIITKVAGVQAQTTYQSSTVMRSAQGLLAWLSHADPANHSGRLLALIGALNLVCYAAGGAVGALTVDLGATALLLLLVPLAVALLLAHREVQQGARL